MRTILFALALLFPLHASANDKIKHFAASAVIAGTTYYVTGDKRIALLVGLGVGIGKELYDRRRSGFSGRDLAADALGVVAGVSIRIAF